MKPILAIQGSTNQAIQSLMLTFARHWAMRGVRIAGLVEVRDEAAETVCARDRLRDLVTGRTFPIHQDLGPGSTACQLAGTGVAEACETIRRQILAGCDLAVLSKFGKLEAGRSGLVAAFAAAVETGTPILTAVAPRFTEEWATFSGPLAALAPPCRDRLDAWWDGLRTHPSPLMPDTAHRRVPMVSVASNRPSIARDAR